MSAVLLLMFRKLILLITVSVFGCSDPKQGRATYDNGLGNPVPLTQEFTSSLRELVDQDGRRIPPPNPDEPPLAIAPEGAIELDGKTYDLYPGFLREGDTTWRSNATIDFFQWSDDPAKFRPTE